MQITSDRIKAISLHAKDTIRAALKAIDVSGLGVAFVVDDNEALVALATDGDLRRALLAGCSMEAVIDDVARRDFVFATVGDSVERVDALLNATIHFVPIVDDRRRIVDLALHDKRVRLPVASPHFGDAELRYLTDCVLSGWISSAGPYVQRFERLLAESVGVRHAISVCNGTAALHVTLAALDLQPDDEVIVPTLTFAATANAVLHAGAVPVFVDSEPTTWNIAPEGVRRAITSRTRAIIPVHLYGHPADMAAILEIAAQHRLTVIEDAAEAQGARCGGRLVGSLGHAACLSFYGNKIITTGEGGAVLTDDDSLAERIRLLRDHGMNPSRRYWHDVVGYNYRMTNMQAAIGTAQMESAEAIFARRAEIARRYDEGLASIPFIRRPPHALWADPVCWLYTVTVDDENGRVSRDELMARLATKGVDTRPVFFPVHAMPPYRRFAVGEYPVAERLSRTGISLPSSTNLRDEEIAFVVKQVHATMHDAAMV